MSQTNQTELGGNTKTPSHSKYQAYLWIITLPAENIEAEELSQNLKEFCKKFTFQKEKGETTGYIHWQIFISLKTKEYFQTVKNLFPSKAHIEPCKDGWAASKYCSKESTRIEGPYTEKSTFIKIIKKLYPWQDKLKDLLLEEPDDRTIHWYWENKGNIGKSAFCKYMVIKHGAQVFNNGSFKDLAQAINENPKIIIFDLPRTLEEKVNYSAIEAIKNGIIFSGKYESKTKIFNPPHIVVFSNFEPKKESMSLDRWNIVNL